MKRNKQPTGRTYSTQRLSRSHAASRRHTHAGLRKFDVNAVKPILLNLKTFFAGLPKRLKMITPLRAAIVCFAVLLCVSVSVVLAVSMNGGSKPAALDAQSKTSATPMPSSEDTSLSVADPSPSSDPTSAPPLDPVSTVIREGDSAPVVADIQSRLMDLGYMDEDEPTEFFGPTTSSAISLFQRQHQLSVDGSVGPDTYNLLMSDDAQNYTVMEGASGDDVTEMQKRLRDLGFLDQVTGDFDESTTKAVKTFQEYNGLAADGKVGQKTFDLLYSADVKPYFLKYGEQSDKVKTYQQRLNSLGYLTNAVDGKYGKDTVAAVERFQEINGLVQDGFLGQDTVDLLMSSKAHANALVLGMQGNDVENAQNRLKTLGYMSHVTGYFGSETEDAVKAFQKRNGISADGSVGSQTMSKLTSNSAKKAASTSSGSSKSGSKSSGKTGSKTTTSQSGVEKFISIAESKLGDKYVWGAKGPNTFDCSGFVYYCLNHAGVKQGYLTAAGWAASGRYQKITSIDNLKRGDIIAFSGSSVGHVGIYLGNGSMIDASSSNGKVIKRSGIWGGSYWRNAFICAFRVY